MLELGLLGKADDPTHLAVQAVKELLEEALDEGKSIKDLKWRARCSMSCELAAGVSEPPE